MFYARLIDEKMVVVAPSGNTSSSSSTSPMNSCPSCGRNIQDELLQNQEGGGIIHKLGSDLLPSGVKFDPNDQEIIEHLEAKVLGNNIQNNKLHPLIHQFIPTLEGDNGICYTHPERLPGVSKDGQLRHFFHRPSKAYTTGTRKRRKVHSNESTIDGSETRWHKTGKTRPVVVNGTVRGFKKILVLYTNYGRQRKPEKTNWVMHQYHIGHCEDENDGEMVVSKVFYQTQPRQSSSTTPPVPADRYNTTSHFRQQLISYIDDQQQQKQGGGATSSFIRFAIDSSKK